MPLALWIWCFSTGSQLLYATQSVNSFVNFYHEKYESGIETYTHTHVCVVSAHICVCVYIKCVCIYMPNNVALKHNQLHN